VKPALAAVALAAALICAPAARAATPVVVPNGVAACQWLKITVTAHMQDVLPEDTGLGARHSSKAPCYLLLTYTPNDPNDAESPPYGSYSGPVLCQIDGNGDWEMMTADPDAPLSATAFPDGNAVGIDDYMTFMNSSGDVIQGFGTHVLHISVDKTGAFRSATFQTVAGELLDNSTFFLSDLPVIGSFTSKGSSVPAAKVPPGAVALVTPSPCSP
jgi:hypothetical protein